MSRRTHVALSLAWALLLLVTHLDFWRPQRATLWFGWLPEELLWRLAWMAAAFLFVVHFTARVWGDPEEERPR